MINQTKVTGCWSDDKAEANQYSQLLCSIEKAVWKLAQSGLSTAAKIYYYRIFYTSTFFSNGRISETKRRILNALVPKFSYRRGLSSPLSWKWPRPTLSSSFSHFLERRHFFGVFQVGQIGPLRAKTCPWDPFPPCKKETIPGSPIDRFPECFVTSFISASFGSFSHFHSDRLKNVYVGF